MLKYGIIDDKLIQSLIQIIKKEDVGKQEFLLVEKSSKESYYIDSVEELNEIIEVEDYGTEIYFFPEPNWLNESTHIHFYYPNDIAGYAY